MKLTTTGSNTMELWLTPVMENYFKDIFEIEMLQGIRIVQDDGMIYYRIEISDEKMVAMKKWFVEHLKQSVQTSIN